MSKPDTAALRALAEAAQSEADQPPDVLTTLTGPNGYEARMALHRHLSPAAVLSLLDRLSDLEAVLPDLEAVLPDLEAVLPSCRGEWTGGSGGHRVYAGGCNAVGVWDVGLGHVCDDHKNRNGGDDDALSWFETNELMHERDKRIRQLEAALVKACQLYEDATQKDYDDATIREVRDAEALDRLRAIAAPPSTEEAP